MKVTATATPNIALIKYWGNRNNALRLPAADSLSMTLNEPSITLSLEASDAPVLRSFMMDGTEKELKPQEIQRFTTVIDFARRYIATLHGRDVLPHACAIDIRSAVPPRIGLASSAAVFAAFAKAIAGLVRSDIALTDAQTSVIARFGAGSAARSIFGGFASIHAGIGDAIDSAYAQSIADETTWNLHDIVIVPSHEEKKYGSTEGHALAHTSPYFAERIRQIPRRMEECIAAIQRKDFEKLQRVSEEDALDMHHVMETSTPSLQYLSNETHRIINEIERLRSRDHLEVLYTMDAGPTVHLLCTDDALPSVLDIARAEEKAGCTIYRTAIGSGARLL